MRALIEALDRAASRTGELHVRVNALCQAAAWLAHVGLFVLFLVTDAEPVDEAFDPSEAADLATSIAALDFVVDSLLGLLYIGLLVFFAITPIALIWTPLNAIGLWRRWSWARRSAMAYAVFAILTVFGVPDGLYALWSLRRPGMKESFAQRPAIAPARRAPAVAGEVA